MCRDISGAELEKYVAERYGALDQAEEISSTDDEDYESGDSSIDDETGDDVARMSLQPSPRDPILWLVK